MKKINWPIFILGVFLIIISVYALVKANFLAGIICGGYGIPLGYLGFRESRKSLLIFGHACIALGCLLVTLGIYLLPSSEPTLVHLFTRPLFWGLFSIFGGICANYHGFCNCIRKGK